MTKKLYVIRRLDTKEYFIGYNKFSNQLRKAKIYTSLHWANESANDTRFKNKGIEFEILEVEINLVKDD